MRPPLRFTTFRSLQHFVVSNMLIISKEFEDYKLQNVVFMKVGEEAGQRLKKWRKNKGLTQKALAQILGVSQQTVASWEVGRTEIPLWALKKLKEEFNLDLNWLIAGKSQ